MAGAGRVFVRFTDGVEKFVSAESAARAVANKDGEVVKRVKMKADAGQGPIVREFPGARVPPMWQERGEVMAPDDTTQGQSLPQALGVAARRGAGDVVATAPGMLAASMIPGVGVLPAAARFATQFGFNAPAEMGGQALRGEPVDPGRAATSAGIGAAVGLPFEAGAALLPKLGPKMLADVLRPSKSQQKALERTERRRTGSRTTADFERAGRQLASERLRPSMEAEAALQAKGEAVNQSVDDILDQATAAGHTILPTTLTRSPEIAALRKEMAKEMDPASARRAINSVLKAFVRGRSTPGTANVQPHPTGVLDARGSMVMTPFRPGAPARQRPMTPSELASPSSPDVGEKQVWRREAAVINKAREQGTSTDKIQGTEARVSDALARAAKRQVEGLPFTTADPEAPAQQIGAQALNERLEGRIPLQEMLRDFNMRPPLSPFERYGLIRGRLPLSENVEGGLGLAFSDPNYAGDLLRGGKITSAAAQDATRRGTKPR